MSLVREYLLGYLLPGLTARKDDGALMVASGKRLTFTATIADGASLSGAVDLGQAALAAVVCPAGMEGTSMTFQVSHDNGVTFNNLYDASGEYTLTVAASRVVVPDLTMFAGAPIIKVRTGTAAAGTPQTGAASISLLAIA